MGHIKQRTRVGKPGPNGEPGKATTVWRTRYRDAAGEEHSKNFRRKADADAFLRHIEGEVSRGAWTDPAQGQALLRDYVATWQAHQVARPGTLEAVDSHLRTWVLPHLGRRRIGSLRAADIRAWVKLLEAELAASTVHTVYAVLRGLLRQAVDDRVIPSTPCVRIRLPKIERPEVVPLTTEQVLTLFDVVPERWLAAVLTAAGTGLRQGEVLGLHVGRVDFLRRSVTVDQQLVTPARGAPYLGPPKSHASRRTVPLPQVVAEELSRHLATWAPQGGFVFTDRHGRPIRRNRAGETMRRYFDRAGLDHASFHDLRHFYASTLIAAGENPKVIQKRLGHASIQETFDTYGHLFPESDETTRAAVDKALASRLGGPSAGQASA